MRGGENTRQRVAVFALAIGLAASAGCAIVSRVRLPVPKAYLDASEMAGWDIVVADDAIASEKYAAEEFQRFFGQATGLDLPVRNNAETAAGHVYIGPGEAFERSGCAFRTDRMGEEELRIVVKRDRIAIAGGRPRGTLYGVYQFLEDSVGVRFLTPDHTYVPDADELKIPCGRFAYRPPFSFRWSYYRQNTEHPEFAARLRVNTVTPDEKFGGKTRQNLINHSLYRQLPVSKYGETHPEYFALVRGERKLDVGGGGPEPCVTNPEVIEIVAEAVIRELDANPTLQNVSVSQNDNAEYCRCPRCEEINRREGTPMGAHLMFVNAVAERVEKKYPNVKIGTLAYWYTRKAPKTVRPRHNVQIQLCSIECCTLHPIDDPDCARNRNFCRDMREWARICDDIWIWNYNTNFRSYDLPFPNLRSIGPNVRYFLENNAKGLFMQANGNGKTGELCDLRNYIISRVIWNPELDAAELLEEFVRLHYGKAARPMLDYINMLHDNADQSGLHPGCFPRPEEVGLNPEIARKAFEYFEQALALAEDDDVRERVEKASICAYKAMIEAGGYLQYRDGALCVSDLPKKYDGLIDRYIALCNKYDMTHAAETASASDYFKLITGAGAGVPAVRCESPVWNMTVVPSANAQVVELTHKPTGRNLFRALTQCGLYIRSGTFEEEGEVGYDHRSPFEFSAATPQTPRSVTMTKTLPDGSTIVRTIGLDMDNPGKIVCETVINHQGAEPKEYQIKVHPEFDAATRSGNADILTGYVLDDGRWTRFNDEWDMYEGPNDELLTSAHDGAFAFFNHKAGFGMAIIYEPTLVDYPRFWWNPNWSQVNLELFTKKVTLGKGDSFSFQYAFEHLSQPPGS